MKMQTIATTRRFLSAKSTSRSIIEEHSALHDNAIAGFQAAPDDGIIPLLKANVHAACFETPRGDLDEHLICIILQNQRCRRHDGNHLLRSEEGYIGEHARLEPEIRIREADTDF